LPAISSGEVTLQPYLAANSVVLSTRLSDIASFELAIPDLRIADTKASPITPEPITPIE
jgi:hypothetical protein